MDISDKFGKLLFGNVSSFYGGDGEKNTQYEDKIFKQLYSFIYGEYMNKDIDSVIIKSLKELLKYKNEFPKVLKSQGNKTLYRGVTWSSDKVKKHISNNIDITKLETVNIKNQLYYKLPITYIPSSIVQSWTTNIDVADSFSFKGADTNKFPILLESNVPQTERIFSKIFLNALNKYVIGKVSESEIIRVGGSIASTMYIYDDSLRNILDMQKPNWKRRQKLNYDKAPVLYGKSTVEFKWFNPDGSVSVIIQIKNKSGKYINKDINVPLDVLIKQNQ